MLSWKAWAIYTVCTAHTNTSTSSPVVLRALEGLHRDEGELDTMAAQMFCAAPKRKSDSVVAARIWMFGVWRLSHHNVLRIDQGRSTPE